MSHKLEIDKEFMQLIPPLQEEEYLQLEQNILTRGKLLNPIILWNGIIVDGHNRFYICMKHGIEFEFTEIEFTSREDAKYWILENQLGRRNLTDAMRIEIALSLKEVLEKRAKQNHSLNGGDKKSEKSALSKSSKAVNKSINARKIIAKKADVGDGTLYRYMRIKEDGSPELLEKVINGEVKIGTAYRMLATEIEKQFNQADKWHAYIKQRAPFNKDDETDREINKRLAALDGQLQALLTKIAAKKGEI